MRAYKFDFFICHASEDKNDVAKPLALELNRRNHGVWYDEFTLTVGDRLSVEIDRGLKQSRFGIVILSPAFFGKGWPERELSGLVARETIHGRKVILPIWHNVDEETILDYSPTLADIYATSTKNGISECVEQVIQAFKKDLVFPLKQTNGVTQPGMPFFETPDGRKIYPGDYVHHPQTGNGSVSGVAKTMMTVRIEDVSKAGARRVTFVEGSEGLSKLRVLESEWSLDA